MLSSDLTTSKSTKQPWVIFKIVKHRHSDTHTHSNKQLHHYFIVTLNEMKTTTNYRIHQVLQCTRDLHNDFQCFIKDTELSTNVFTNKQSLIQLGSAYNRSGQSHSRERGRGRPSWAEAYYTRYWLGLDTCLVPGTTKVDSDLWFHK